MTTDPLRNLEAERLAIGTVLTDVELVGSAPTPLSASSPRLRNGRIEVDVVHRDALGHRRGKVVRTARFAGVADALAWADAHGFGDYATIRLTAYSAGDGWRAHDVKLEDARRGAERAQLAAWARSGNEMHGHLDPRFYP